MKKNKSYRQRILTLFIVFILLFTTIPFFSFTVSAGTPTVTTNDATGIKATNATLQGTLSDDGGEFCYLGFEYGLTTGYGSNISSSYVYAGGSSPQKVYQYWPSNMTKKAETVTYGGVILSIIEDSTYIYVCGTSSGNSSVRQYQKSDMALKATATGYGGILYGLNQDDTYVYAVGATTRRICQYWKSNMTKKAQSSAYGSDISSICSDDTYIYFGSLSQKVSQYWKSNLTLKQESAAYGDEINTIDEEGDYIYAGGSTINKVYQYWKTNLTKKAESASYGGAIFRVICDGDYVYVAGYTTYKVFKLWASNLTKKAETASYGGNIEGLSVDENYVYAGGVTTNTVRQYKKSDLSYVTQSASYSSTIYAISSSPTYKTGDAFFINAIGLTPGTLYHYRAYANNTAGETYGSDKTILSKPNVPTGLSITNYNGNQQNLSWTHGTGYNRSVVRGSIGSYPATPQSGTDIYNNTGNTVINTGLTIGNTWYYRVWEYTTWAGESKFSETYTQGTLMLLIMPTVLTNDATGIKATNTTLQGTVSDDGGMRSSTGFEYGLTAVYGTRINLDLFTKKANSVTLPTGNGNGVAFSTNGTYMAVAHTTNPFVTIYKMGATNGTYYKLANPASLPASTGYAVAFSNDDRYLAVAHATTPFVTIYNRSGDTFTKIANPGTLPTGTGMGVAFSCNGPYMAVAHATTPFVTIYKITPTDTFTKLANPNVLPAGNAFSTGFSSDGTYLAVGHATTPFVTIYKYGSVNHTFYKLPNPGTLPAGIPNGISFSSNGVYLALAITVSPYINIYKRSGDTFTKLTSPAPLPATARGVAFSPDNTYMTVAHDNSPYVTIHKRSGDTFTKLTDPTNLPAGNGLGVAFVPSTGYYMAVAHATSPYVTVYRVSYQTSDSISYNIVTTAGTLYHYRAYANNTAGEKYGSDKTVLTKPNAPTGLSITNYNGGQQNLSWTHGTGYNRSVVRGSIGSYPATPQSGTDIYNDTGNTVINTGLTIGDVWYYRVWEYTTWAGKSTFSETYAQGNLENFLVATNDATGIEEINATLHGTLTNKGVENCTVGFEYGLTTSYGTKVVPYSFQSTFIYAGGVGGKLSQYWQSNMTRKQNATIAYGGNIRAILEDAAYVYVAGETTLKVYQYWKSNLTKKAETSAYSGAIWSLTQDDTYIYVGGANTTTAANCRIWRYVKSNLATAPTVFTTSYGGIIYALAQDATYLYAGGLTTNVPYRYTKSSPTTAATAFTTTYGATIWTINAEDSTYLYVGGGAGSKAPYRYTKATPATAATAFTTLYGGIIYALAQDATYLYVGGATTNKPYAYTKTSPTTAAITTAALYGGTIQALSQDTSYVYAVGATTNKIYRYTKSDWAAAPTQSTSYVNIIYAISANNNYYSTGQTFSFNLTGLTPGMLCHYRAYANNSLGGTIGLDKFFFTKTNAPTTLVVENLDSTQQKITWTHGTGYNRSVVRGSIGSYPATPQSGTDIYNDTGRIAIHTVTPGNTWYYRVWEYTTWAGESKFSDGYAQGYITSPTVTTDDATGIKATNTTLCGTLTYDGNESSIAGFEYGSTTSYGTKQQLGYIYLIKGENKVYQYWNFNMTKKKEATSTGPVFLVVADDSDSVYGGTTNWLEGGYYYPYLRKYSKSTLTQTASFGYRTLSLNYGQYYAIDTDSDYVYAGGFGNAQYNSITGAVGKYQKSDLALIETSASYGNRAIYSIVCDDTYVFAGGAYNPPTSSAVNRYLKTNLATVLAAPAYGGTIYALADDYTYIYAGGDTNQTVKQYWKTNMTLKKFSKSYGGVIKSIIVDDTYVYVAGATNQTIKQYWKTNMTLKKFSAKYGGDLNTLIQDKLYIYAGGATTNKIYQYWKSNLTRTSLASANIGAGISISSSVNTYTTGNVFSMNLVTTPGTLYHYRAYVSNSFDEVTGADKKFLTKPNEPTNLVITNYNTQQNLTWTHGTGYNRSVVRGQIGSYPANPQSGIAIYNGTNNIATNPGLSRGDAWYYCVWEYTVWGQLSCFSDASTQSYSYSSTGSPTVATNDATGVEETNVTLQGTLTDSGGEPCTVGFQYGLTTAYGTAATVPVLPTYIYVGGAGGTLSKYWQSNMTLKQSASILYGGTINALVQDDTYIYVAGATNQTVKQYWKSNMTLTAFSANYSGTIYALAQDVTYIYAGGAAGVVSRYLKSNLKTAPTQSITYGGTIYALSLDSTYIYAAGANSTTAANARVKKYWTSNMTKAPLETSTYGGTIYALTQDATYIYAGGGTVFLVRQYTKSTMALSASSASYTGIIYALAQDSIYVYAGGAFPTPANSVVNKYLKTNLATVTAASSVYGGPIYALTVDSNCVYAGGGTVFFVRKYTKATMILSLSSPTYGGTIQAVSSTDDYYSTGNTFSLNASSQAKTYEYYAGSNDNWASIRTTYWAGQTFTVGNVGANEEFYLTSVNLALWRAGSDNGQVWIHIRATSGGLPTGSDLCNAYVMQNTLGTSASSWKLITFTSPARLYAGTTYAVLVNCTAEVDINHMMWEFDNTAPAYSGGSRVNSTDGGSSWTATTGNDFGFYCFNGIITGTLYHYRAYANNTAGETYGSDKTFLTKPYAPTGLVIVNFGTAQQNLSWTHGIGYNRSVVRGSIGSYPATPQSGIAIYNGTGGTVVHSGLSQHDDWYYRVWEYITLGALHQYSDAESNHKRTDVVVVSIVKKAESPNFGSQIYALTSDDTYVFAGGSAYGVVYQYWKSNMTYKAQSPSYAGQIRALVSDTNYVYAGGQLAAQSVRQYWKSNMTLKAQTPAYSSSIYALTLDDTYVYAAGLTTERIRQYWKSNMTYKAQSEGYGSMIKALTSDTNYVYAGGGTNAGSATVRQYWKSNMTRKAQSANYGGDINALTVDDTYVYAGGATTTTVCQYWKSNMTFKAQSPGYGGAIYALSSDTDYIYVSGQTASTVKQYWKSDLALKAVSDSYGNLIYALTLDTNYIYAGGASTGGGKGVIWQLYKPSEQVDITLISPQNNSLVEGQSYANLTVDTSGFATPINVKFYNASSNTLLKQYTAVGLGTYYYNWTNLPAGVRRYWYVIVNGTTANLKSETWNFMPNDVPVTMNMRVDSINQNNITVKWTNEPDMEWISLKIGSEFMEVRKILGVYQTWLVPNLFKETVYNLQWQVGDNLTSMSDYHDFDFRTAGWKPDIKNFTYRQLITVNRSGLSGDANNYAFNLTLTDDNFRYSSGPNWWDPNYPAFLHLNYTSKKDIRFTNYYNTKYYDFDIQSWNVPGDGGIETQVLPNETSHNGAFIDPTWAHDNDWLTKTTPSPHGVLYYNYTIPVGAKTTSKFRVYQGEWIWDVELPSGCYNSKLRFKSVCDYDTPYIGTYVWNYTSSAWLLLQNDTARYFYESQMNWEYDAKVTIFVMPEHFDDTTQTNVNGVDADYDTKVWMYYGNPGANDNETVLSYSGVHDGALTFGDEEEYAVNPPTISNVVEYNETSTSVNITWDTDEIADGRIKYATNPWFFGSKWAYRDANKTETFEHMSGNDSHVEKLYAYSSYYLQTINMNCSYYPFSNNPAYYYINKSTGDEPAKLHLNATGRTEFLNWTLTYKYNKTIEWATYSPDFMIPNLPATNTQYYYQILAIGEGGNTTYDGDFILGTLPSTPHAVIMDYDEDRPNHTVTVWANLTDMNGEPYVDCSIQYWNEDSTDFSETSSTHMTTLGQFSKTISVDYGHTYSYRVKAGTSTGYSDVRGNNFMPMQEFFAGNYIEDNDNNGTNPDFRDREYRPPNPNGTVNMSAKAYNQTGYWEGSLQTEDWMWVETNITGKGALTLHLYTKEYGHVGDYAMTNDTDSNMKYLKLTSLNSSWYTFYITGTGGQMVLNWTKPSLIHREHQSRVDESKYVSFNATPLPVNYTLLYMDTLTTNTSAYRWSIASGLDIYSAMGVEYWGGGLETGLVEANVGTKYDRGQLFRGGVWNGEPYDTGELQPVRNTKPMGANRYCFAFTSYDWNLSLLPSNHITNYYYRYWSLNNHWSEYLGYDQTRTFDYIYLMQFKYDTVSFTRDWKAIDNTTIYTEKRVDNVSASVFNTSSNQSLLMGYKSGFDFDPSNDNIWNFGFYTDGRWTNQQVGQYQQAFVIFNLPSNTTLQGMDSDSDGLNDYDELFVYYTNPKSNNTDEDGFADNIETLASTDPNNYKDEPGATEITISQPYENQTYALNANISTQTTIASDFAADYNISVWSSEGTLVEVLRSNTVSAGGGTINVSWNSTGEKPGDYILKVNVTDPYNPTVYATRNFTILAFTTKHITITATPAGTLSIVVDPNIWDGGGASIGENYSTSSDAFTLENIGTVYADVTVEATDSTTWSLSTAPAHNKFQMQWDRGDGWCNLGLTPASFVTGLACGSTQQFGLKICMPTSSSVNADQVTIITFRATAN